MNAGWRTFLIVWSGQMVSLLGTAMIRFALLIWAYQQTGAATPVALMFLCTWALGTLTSLTGYAWRPARRVEVDLPDHAAVAAASS